MGEQSSDQQSNNEQPTGARGSTREAIRATVRAYVDAVGRADPEQISALFSADATVEDPVGSPVHAGRAAIAAFYRQAAGYDNDTELLDCRIAGNEAAFLFRVTTTLPDATVEVFPIDTMTVDADGRITGMRAYWHASDYRTTQR